MMLLGDVLLCPPVVTAPSEKAPLWVCCLRQTTQVDHGAVAFAAAMRPSIEMASALPSDKSAVGHSRRSDRAQTTSGLPG
jgi:hypothetical protein